MGVQTCRPGATHHGQPMQIVSMGQTQLDLDTILAYLESLKEVYTPESYDLFAHNCNNFTNDFAMFLVGRGIPDYIVNLPRQVLETPFGQMLKPQIDAGMRGITQAPVPPQNVPQPTVNASRQKLSTSTPARNGSLDIKAHGYGSVVEVSSLRSLQEQLGKAAASTAATVLFTSANCAPCKLVYPTFDRLAEQHLAAFFVKVDIGDAQEIAAHYQIKTTPTFITFSRGVRRDQWSGADPDLLRSNVEALMLETFPPHPHNTLKLPTLQYGSLKPVTYTKVPPLGKLMAKLGPAAEEENLVTLRSFVEKRADDPKDATLPDLRSIGQAFRTTMLDLPVDVRFAAVDLLRCAMVDPRMAGFFAEEQSPQTIPALLDHTIGLEVCPHNLRLVTLQLACNLFHSQLFVSEIMQSGAPLVGRLVQLVTISLLDASHPTSRVAASSLAFNLAVSNYQRRREDQHEALGESEQVELAASLIESLSGEDDSDATKAMLLALGYLLYCAPLDGELMDLVKALDAKGSIGSCKGHAALTKELQSLI